MMQWVHHPQSTKVNHSLFKLDFVLGKLALAMLICEAMLPR